MENKEIERGNNLKIDNLKNMIIRDINFADMPIAVAYYIMKDLMNEIERLYNDAVAREYKEYCDLCNAEGAAEESGEQDSSNDESAAAAQDNLERTE